MSKIIYRDTTELLRVWPIRNRAWMALDTMFCADASALGVAPGGLGLELIRDPWNRKVPRGSVRAGCGDREGVAFWHFTTTVEGQAWECRFWNT